MVVIRLARGGSKKNPFYHVVVTDKRNARDGRFIERVGYFDPMARGKATRLTLEKEKIQQWIAKGAQPSPRVDKLCKDYDQGTIEAAPSKAIVRRAQAEESAKAAAAKAKAAAKAAKEEPAEDKEEA